MGPFLRVCLGQAGSVPLRHCARGRIQKVQNGPGEEAPAQENCDGEKQATIGAVRRGTRHVPKGLCSGDDQTGPVRRRKTPGGRQKGTQVMRWQETTACPRAKSASAAGARRRRRPRPQAIRGPRQPEPAWERWADWEIGNCRSETGDGERPTWGAGTEAPWGETLREGSHPESGATGDRASAERGLRHRPRRRALLREGRGDCAEPESPRGRRPERGRLQPPKRPRACAV